ncbi:MAG: UPF0272 protein [Candidatus Tectimicrobiota bacterium]|nr:MAG: UPF0272 protein [Candidatus Tectomicrobia bacterium]
MRVLHLEGAAGVTAPALLAALLDAGASLAAVQEGWQRLGLPAVAAAAERVRLGDVPALCLRWTLPPAEACHGVLEAGLSASGLPGRATARLQLLLSRVAAATARVYGTAEAAPWSSLWPVLLYGGSGVVLACEQLDVAQVTAAPLNLGGGFLHPLAAELLRGLPVYGEARSDVETTADGAAVVAALATGFGPLPPLRVVRVGYGTAGAAARSLQVVLGEAEGAPATERLAVLEANIDDMNPELFESVFERLLAQGALDVALVPVLMKKQRPAHILTVLAPPALVPPLARLVLCETSSFGVRVYETWRYKLERFHRDVETRYGTVPVKCGLLEGRLVQAAPEYEACKRLARERGVPVRLVYAEAMRQAAAWLAD